LSRKLTGRSSQLFTSVRDVESNAFYNYLLDIVVSVLVDDGTRNRALVTKKLAEAGFLATSLLFQLALPCLFYRLCTGLSLLLIHVGIDELLVAVGFGYPSWRFD
jgi:hypothetical protein